MKLELIKMGNNINKNDLQETDLSSYRYLVKDFELKNTFKVIKNVFNEITKKYEEKEFEINKLDYLEISSGARYTNDIKKIDMFGCWFDTEYHIEIGNFRLFDLEKELNSYNYNSKEKTYNKQFILNMVNSISKNKYTEIVETDRW